MRIFITGGTGFVGSYLTQKLISLGHEVMVLTRSAKRGPALLPGGVLLEGNPSEAGPWQENLARHEVIINLAGRSIFGLWTKEVQREIMDSRLLTTRNVVDALQFTGEGKLLISTSAVGYYGNRTDDTLLDESSPQGDGFLAEVGQAWEQEAKRGEQFGARVVNCRFGIVLGRNGGALKTMVPAFRYYLASPLGSGRQWFPWIHLEDIFGITTFVIEHKNIAGPINCTAPYPVRNGEFTEALARALGKSVIMPSVPGFLVRTLLGEFGGVLLGGQRAIPKRLLDSGYPFRFPALEETLRDLIGNKM